MIPPRARATVGLYSIAWLLFAFSDYLSNMVRSGAYVRAGIWLTGAALAFVGLSWVAIRRDARDELSGVAEEEEDPSERASLPARISWAVCLATLGVGCLQVGALADALAHQYQSILQRLGFVFFLAAAYKLFFGRRGTNSHDDWLT